MSYFDDLEVFKHLVHAMPLTLEASQRLWLILEEALANHPEWEKYVVNNCFL